MTRLTDRNIELADDDTIAMCRRMTGGEKRRQAGALFRMTRRLLATRLRKEHPEWDDAELTRQLFRRLHGGS